MNLTFLEIFTLISIIHCFALSLILLRSKFFKNDQNKYLAYTLVIIAIVGLNNWFWDIDKHPLIISFLDIFLWQFLYSATFLIYFQKATFKESKIKKRYIIYLPFIILSFLNAIISFDQIFNLYSIPFLENETLLFYFYKAISLFSIFYPLLMIYLAYTSFHKGIETESLKWLKFIWYLSSTILFYGVVLESFRFVSGIKLPLTYLWITISIFIYYLVYKGVYQFKLSNERFKIRQHLKLKDKNHADSSKKSDLNPIFLKLIDLFETEAIQSNPELTRELVATKLGISSGYLSQIIAGSTNKNFSDLVNEYRINAVKRMIFDPDFENYDLLSIGLESGFNSKTSFFTTFKKETGLSPNQFKKSYKDVPNS